MGQIDKLDLSSKRGREGLRLVKAFEKITDPEEREKIIAMAEAAAKKAASPQRS